MTPSVLGAVGLALSSFGVAAALVAAYGLWRCHRAATRIHVMSIGAVAALGPCLLGAALVLGDGAALVRALIAAAIAIVVAPFLGQALLLRALVDGEIPPPESPLEHAARESTEEDAE